MKAIDMKSLGDDELSQKEITSREELFNLKFQHAIGKLENSARLKELKKDVARILTEKRSRSLRKDRV